MQDGPFTLVMGDKNISSWSLRPWLMLRQCGVSFEEQIIRLRQPDSQTNLRAQSPSRLVPFLKHGPRVIWESLAIGEYLADRFPQAGLWPEDEEARAVARSVSAQMHAGFAAMRQTMPMDICARVEDFQFEPKAQEDVDQVIALWAMCRNRFGGEGVFLFGRHSIADAMFAPVVTRFKTYGVRLSAEAAAYAEAVWARPDFQLWVQGAREELMLGKSSSP